MPKKEDWNDTKMEQFQLQKRRKNCNCSKTWTNYTVIKARSYDDALDIAVRMSRANKDWSFKIKR